MQGTVSVMSNNLWQHLSPSVNYDRAMDTERVDLHPDHAQKRMERGPPNRLAKGLAAHNMKALPASYTLGPDDVICGRGSTCFNHIGNQRFRNMVANCLDEYSKASSKLAKTYIICDVIHRVRQQSPFGGFVKKDPLTGQFFEVGDFLAREKTSQAFRDALQDKYKSSNGSKKKRRVAGQTGRPKLRKQNSEPSLAGAKSAEMVGSTVDKSDMTKEFIIKQLEEELNASVRRINDEVDDGQADFDFSSDSRQQASQPIVERRSCPDLSQHSLANLELHAWAGNTFANAAPWQPAPISNANSSGMLACGKPNELMEMLRFKADNQQQQMTQTNQSPSIPLTTMVNPLVEPHVFASQTNELPVGNKNDCPTSTGCDKDLFDTLVQITDGCTLSGDPFDPIPFDPNPSKSTHGYQSM